MVLGMVNNSGSILNAICFTIILVLMIIAFNHFDNRLDDIEDEIDLINYSDLTIQINKVTWEEIDANKSILNPKGEHQE
jgi:hypothetical protein